MFKNRTQSLLLCSAALAAILIGPLAEGAPKRPQRPVVPLVAALGTPFTLGDAAQFVFLGDAATRIRIEDAQLTGNIGVGPGGKLVLEGSPFNLTGNVFFADPIVVGTNYIKSDVNNISGVEQQNNAWSPPLWLRSRLSTARPSASTWSPWLIFQLA